MKALLKKTAALLSASVLMTAMTACSSESGHDHEHHIVEDDLSDDVNVEEENLPYGATMTSLKKDHNDKVKIDIDFDPRYFTEDGEQDYPEIYLITDYIEAMQNKDGAAINEIFYKPYLDYLMSRTSYADSQAYIDSFMNKITSKTGDGIEFNYAVVDTCLNENESENLTEFEAIDSTLDEITGENISEKVQSRKLVYVDIFFSGSEGNYSQLNECLGNDLSVYIYNIDGRYYLL